MICPKCGAPGAKRNGAGRGRCVPGRHSFTITPEIEAAEAADARTGNAPEYGIDHPLPAGLKLKGVSTLTRNARGEPQWIKADEDAAARERIMRAAVEAFAKKLPAVKPRKASGMFRDDLLAVYPIGDPHFGMYSWADETGENWDLDIAERTHCEAMAALVAAVPRSREALVVNLGDALHYDSMANVTPRSGHVVDADGRYGKMIDVAVLTLRQCIDSALGRHETVHVKSLIGNHDETGALWLARLLAAHYRNEPRVRVDTSPSVFTYHRWGKVLIGCHHGHSCKPDKLPGVMACDRARDWGETEHRHWLMGHVHHESRREYAGVTVESFGTLAAKDAYATNGGWRSGRSMQALIYHREHGEVARSRVTAAMFEAAA